MKIKKILLIAILFISIIFSTSYAIDETALFNTTSNQIQTTSQNTNIEQPVQST